MITQIPLSGNVLIEASAGSGKTYTLCKLYLRLLLEKQIPIEQLLTVTFTEAATQELKSRIRAELQQFIDDNNQQTITEHLELAKKALLNFDEAAIHTIHGFCQRVLTEYAFEFGHEFDRDVVANADELLTEIIADYWRSSMTQAQPLFCWYLMHKKITPASLTSNFKPLLSYVNPIIKPDDAPLTDIEPYYSRWVDAITALTHHWESEKEAIKALILSADRNKNQMKPSTCQQLFHHFERWIENNHFPKLQALQLPTESVEKFCQKFTLAKLKKATKKGKLPPEHPFFEQCEQVAEMTDSLHQMLGQQWLQWQRTLLLHLITHFPDLKANRRLLTFDDMLREVYFALQGEGKERIRQLLRTKYPVALIDEFQDTDALQYDIFRSVYGPDQFLCLIGDPKQAIYRFRGADIYTYFRARQSVDQIFSLDTNWRSVPPLIEAFNHLYSQCEQPFQHPQMPYLAVQHAQKQHRYFSIREQQPAPLQLWHHHANTKPQGEQAIIDACVDEIVKLCQLGQIDQAKLGDHPVKPHDIAILVRTRKQADAFYQALSSAGVPCVSYNRPSVLHTREAQELRIILEAIAQPTNTGLLKAALCTQLVGHTGDDLLKLEDNPSHWSSLIEQFIHYQQLWSQHGLIRCMDQFVNQQQVAERLLQQAGGERRLTNLYHLFDWLHQQITEHHLSITGTLQWLFRKANETTTDDQELRLESDASRASIMTIHKSKGLQFPIVFCPFLLGGQRPSETIKSLPDTDGQGQQLIDLGDPALHDNHQARLNKESKMEDLRLIYVALTRAESRCYLIWHQAGKTAKNTALDDLLIPDQSSPDNKVLAFEQKLEALAQSIQAHRHCIDLAPLPDHQQLTLNYREPPQGHLSARPFHGAINRSWTTTSYTRLVSNNKPLADDIQGKDLGELFSDTGALETLSTNQQLPKGASSGLLLHTILELIDFQSEAAAISEVITAQIHRFGFDPQWQPWIEERIEVLLHKPLLSHMPSLRLASLSPEQCIDELDFHFAFTTLNHQQLANAVKPFEKTSSANLSARLKRLNIPQQKGMIKGFIDLVFEHEGKYYLVDYKSNTLGSCPEDYNQQAMAESIQEHHYDLQYLIYTLALYRLLGQHLDDFCYEQHMGGVFYLYLRGMEPATHSDHGIYFTRPEEALIQSLDRLFSGEGA